MIRKGAFATKRRRNPFVARSAGALARQSRLALTCQRGVASIEFALILPLMVLLFFGLVEGSDALSASRRVATAVNSLADLAAQAEDQLTADDVSNLFTGVEKMLEPTSSVPVEFKLISVILDDDEPVIHWSIDNAGNEPYAEGDEYTGLEDATLLNEDASLIVVEIVYEHETSLANRVFDETITFSRRATRWPRIGSRVNYCTAPGDCTS